MSAARPTCATVFAEGLPRLVHARMAADTLLQFGVPLRGRALAAMESPAAVSADRGGPGLSPCAESPLA
jgi:hypothetical protein